MYKLLFLPLLMISSLAAAQSRGVVVPIPDTVAQGLSALEMLTGRQILAPLTTPLTRRFGARGQNVLGGNSGLLLSGAHRRLAGGYHANSLAVDLRLVAGRFWVQNLLFGVSGGYATDLFDTDYGQPTRGHIGPVAGYNFVVHEHADFLPTLALSYDTWTAPSDAALRHHEINIGIDLSFVMHIGQALALTLAPFVKQSVYHSVHAARDDARLDVFAAGATWDTLYGIKVGILGWF